MQKIQKIDHSRLIEETGLKGIVEEWKQHAMDETKSAQSFRKTTACLLFIYDTCVLSKNKKGFSTDFPIENMTPIIGWITKSLAAGDSRTRSELNGAFGVELARHQNVVFCRQKVKIHSNDVPVDFLMSDLAVTMEEKETEVIAEESDDDKQEQEREAKMNQEDEEEDEGDASDTSEEDCDDDVTMM